MAATQAEKQQNDVNSEKVQPDQHLNVRNTLLQNGTEKSGARASGSVVVTKAKSAGSKNSSGIDMSQYRPDGGGPGASAASGGNGESGMSEQDMGPNSGESNNMYASGPTAVAEGPPVGDGHGGYGFPFGGRDIHNSSGDNIHSGFGARHPGFGGPKQQQQQQQPPPPSSQFPQQRFVSGQTISQPTGPTPTLNQLLQSANPMQRYQNSYGHSSEQPYMQGWPQKTLTTPYSTAPVPGSVPAQSYRTQTTVSTHVLFVYNHINITIKDIFLVSRHRNVFDIPVISLLSPLLALYKQLFLYWQPRHNNFFFAGNQHLIV